MTARKHVQNNSTFSVWKNKIKQQTSTNCFYAKCDWQERGVLVWKEECHVEEKQLAGWTRNITLSFWITENRLNAFSLKALSIVFRWKPSSPNACQSFGRLVGFAICLSCWFFFHRKCSVNTHYIISEFLRGPEQVVQWSFFRNVLGLMQLLLKNIGFLEGNSVSQIKSSSYIRKNRGIKTSKQKKEKLNEGIGRVCA